MTVNPRPWTFLQALHCANALEAELAALLPGHIVSVTLRIADAANLGWVPCVLIWGQVEDTPMCYQWDWIRDCANKIRLITAKVSDSKTRESIKQLGNGVADYRTVPAKQLAALIRNYVSPLPPFTYKPRSIEVDQEDLKDLAVSFPEYHVLRLYPKEIKSVLLIAKQEESFTHPRKIILTYTDQYSAVGNDIACRSLALSAHSFVMHEPGASHTKQSFSAPSLVELVTKLLPFAEQVEEAVVPQIGVAVQQIFRHIGAGEPTDTLWRDILSTVQAQYGSYANLTEAQEIHTTYRQLSSQILCFLWIFLLDKPAPTTEQRKLWNQLLRAHVAPILWCFTHMSPRDRADSMPALSWSKDPATLAYVRFRKDLILVSQLNKYAKGNQRGTFNHPMGWHNLLSKTKDDYLAVMAQEVARQAAPTMNLVMLFLANNHYAAALHVLERSHPSHTGYHNLISFLARRQEAVKVLPRFTVWGRKHGFRDLTSTELLSEVLTGHQKKYAQILIKGGANLEEAYNMARARKLSDRHQLRVERNYKALHILDSSEAEEHSFSHSLNLV